MNTWLDWVDLHHCLFSLIGSYYRDCCHRLSQARNEWQMNALQSTVNLSPSQWHVSLYFLHYFHYLQHESKFFYFHLSMVFKPYYRSIEKGPCIYSSSVIFDWWYLYLKVSNWWSYWATPLGSDNYWWNFFVLSYLFTAITASLSKWKQWPN